MDCYDRYAEKLHSMCPVADAHLDLVTAVYRKKQAGEAGSLKSYYLEKLREGGVNLVFASLFLGEAELEGCLEKDGYPKGVILRKSLEMLSCFLKELDEAGEEAVLVTDRASLSKALRGKQKQGKRPVGFLIYLEGLDMLEGEPELLRCFYAMGVRGAALTWNKRPRLQNPFADGCFAEEKESGISNFGTAADSITDSGVQVISLMEELGIFVDCSHLSREAIDFLPFVTKKPYVATHSNARALAEHHRNLTDEQISRLAARGGIIGVNSYGEFVGEDGMQLSGAERICRQIMYLLEKAGEDHVGLGLDFGEGSCLTGYEELPAITAGLLRMGCPERTVRKVLGENWIRFLWSHFGNR